MRSRFKEITILLWGLFFLFKASLSLAQPSSTASLPDLAASWAKNIMELDAATQGLVAANALLSAENTQQQERIKAFEEKVQSLAKQAQEGNLQKQQLERMQLEKRKALFSALRKATVLGKQTRSLSTEEGGLPSRIREATEKQQDLNIKKLKLQQEINDFEQESFFRQRLEKETLQSFDNVRLAAERFLGITQKKEKEYKGSLDCLATLLRESYHKRVSLRQERQNGMLDLLEAEEEAALAERQCLSIVQKNIAMQGKTEGVLGRYAAELDALQKKQEELKAAIAMQAKERQSPLTIAMPSRFDSSMATLQQLTDENKFFKKEAARLTVVLRQLNQRKRYLDHNL